MIKTKYILFSYLHPTLASLVNPKDLDIQFHPVGFNIFLSILAPSHSIYSSGRVFCWLVNGGEDDVRSPRITKEILICRANEGEAYPDWDNQDGIFERAKLKSL